MTNDYDYGDDAGAGFPEISAMTEIKARALRQDAAQILAAEYLQMKESNKRERNTRAKMIKDAKRQLAYTLAIEYGLHTYTWPDGLCVRIEGPLLRSGRTWDSSIPMQVIFNHRVNGLAENHNH